ncbi:nitronate monooxygenase family protein [Epilithonimonas ginsengisoli]|uniref:Propionate 3-nitronate monooxygenase n=1 Tax=Epilithonimonas ginsengisoli TaxID=1245592 RepID=A0ABU4JD13_9FLAO|nr:MULTISPECIES: nitronate monooxygenase family protein [Chryseobacterium group]MBV6878528.1 nitronate monooxygenase family protein [Epilithonimonas sp. FP105]MDW8547553.1 nitronate monooxygenase family protein [Epilithonimonas ginsengisoli]OAH75153.1 tungsten formylmethanofuran dehydrogenase [Chryseobacterium sp. FP211-J200]
MNWQNNISQVLDIKYPIIQAPMFGVSTPEMVAAASNANCLGSLALGDMSGNDCSKLIRQTKQLTAKNFSVNIFVHQIPEVTDELRINYDKTKSFLQELSKKNHLEVEFPNLEDIKLNSYHEQIKAIITEDCKIVSFTFGNLDSESIEKLKNNGTILIGTCTSVNEAVILENSGIDIICVQGIEAGGHRGSFENYNIPQIGGLSLLSQVYDAVKIPIVYAGGIYNHRTLLATKTLGAQGFQVGTMLMGSQESALQDFEKQRLNDSKEEDIILTKSFSGRYARGIKNTFIESVENTEFILPYPYQNKLTNALRKAAKADKNSEFVSIWTGQSVNQLSRKSTAEILEHLIDKVDKSEIS